MAVTCVPTNDEGTGTLQTNPCLACLSESELLAVIMIALADSANQTVAEALENSACFSCLSKKQLLQSAAAILGQTYLTRYTMNEIRDQIKCLLCAPPGKVHAALLYLLCDYFSDYGQ